MKLFNVLVVAAMTAACGNGAPAENAAATADASKTEPAVVEAKAEVLREVTIPAGTTLRLKLQSAVASDSSEVEDTVRAELRQAVSVEGQAVLPAGTEVVGTVTDVERSGRVKGRAHVAYRFSSLRAAGERIASRTVGRGEPPDDRPVGRSRGGQCLAALHSAPNCVEAAFEDREHIPQRAECAVRSGKGRSGVAIRLLRF